MRRTLKTTLGNQPIILSERSAQDFWDLIAYVDKAKDQPESKNFLFQLNICATLLSQSIQQTRRDLPWYKVIEKLRLRKFTPKYIIKIAPDRELFELNERVLDELEDRGPKKKAPEAGEAKPSAEPSSEA